LGLTSIALVGGTIAAGGMPLLLSILVLWAACVACWDDFQSEEIPTPAIVEEYLDDADVAEMARTELAKAMAREAMAKLRIRELEADNLRLVAQLAQAYKPAAAELLEDNQAVLAAWDYVEVLFDATDCPDPGWRPQVAHA